MHPNHNQLLQVLNLTTSFTVTVNLALATILSRPKYLQNVIAITFLPDDIKRSPHLRSWADPEGGTGGPDPPGKVVIGYFRNSGSNLQLLLEGGPNGPLWNMLMTKKVSISLDKIFLIHPWRSPSQAVQITDTLWAECLIMVLERCVILNQLLLSPKVTSHLAAFTLCVSGSLESWGKETLNPQMLLPQTRRENVYKSWNFRTNEKRLRKHPYISLRENK